LRIAIVTDSTADIPQDIQDRYTIYQLPVFIVIEGKSYRDSIDISRKTFYQQLPAYTPLPTTASPAAGDFVDLYKHIFSQGYSHILSIHISGTLSSVIQTAQSAARELSDRITVFDSQQLSLGLGFQVVEAASQAANNLPLQQILEGLKRLQSKIHLFAVLDTLEYVRKSGRAPWVQAQLGSRLPIKPLIQLNMGQVLSAGFARSRKRAFRQLREKLGQLGPLAYLGIMHSNARQEAQELLAGIDPPSALPPLIVNVTTSIGTHVGPGGIGFAAVVK